MPELDFCKSQRPLIVAVLFFTFSGCHAGDQDTSAVAPPETASPGIATVGESMATVSGISAGGYMAVQAHIALAGLINGAAVLAGGPYHCAEANIGNALGRCMNGTDLDAAPLVEAARQAALAGQISSLEALQDSRVWLFHGQNDQVVNEKVNAALAGFYRAFIAQEQLVEVNDIPAAHGWPTMATGNECAVMGGDFFNACQYDAAGALLQHLYGPLNPPVSMEADSLKTFDQKSLVVEGGYFADEGLAYVPQTCAEPENSCRLHISFHGCRQGQELMGNKFATLTGLNEWAESNGIVVLYPQVTASMFNPQGCWDWWGYTGPDYDRISGKQVASVKALIEAWTK